MKSRSIFPVLLLVCIRLWRSIISSLKILENRRITPRNVMIATTTTLEHCVGLHNMDAWISGQYPPYATTAGLLAQSGSGHYNELRWQTVATARPVMRASADSAVVAYRFCLTKQATSDGLWPTEHWSRSDTVSPDNVDAGVGAAAQQQCAGYIGRIYGKHLRRPGVKKL